jgi:hypothetical protein
MKNRLYLDQQEQHPRAGPSNTEPAPEEFNTTVKLNRRKPRKKTHTQRRLLLSMSMCAGLVALCETLGSGILFPISSVSPSHSILTVLAIRDWLWCSESDGYQKTALSSY